jgi:hypothetical protein
MTEVMNLAIFQDHTHLKTLQASDHYSHPTLANCLGDHAVAGRTHAEIRAVYKRYALSHALGLVQMGFVPQLEVVAMAACCARMGDRYR